MLHWHAQSKPHPLVFGTPPHVIPDGHVPHRQKLLVRPLSLGSPHAIVAPVQLQLVPSHDMPCGQSAWGWPQLSKPQ